MKVGEFFLELGVQGAEKTVKVVGELQHGMHGLKNISLEAKASIIAALYAFEKMFSGQMEHGQTLANTAALLGKNTVEVQRYAQALEKFGATEEEVTSGMLHFREVFAGVRLGQGLPEGFENIFATLHKQLTPDIIRDLEKNPEHVYDLATQYYKSTSDKGVAYNTLKRIGLSDNVIAGIIQGGTSPAALAATHPTSQADLNKQADLAKRTKEMEERFQKLMSDFITVVGPHLITAMEKMTDAMFYLADKFKSYESFLDKGDPRKTFADMKSGKVPIQDFSKIKDTNDLWRWIVQTNALLTVQHNTGKIGEKTTTVHVPPNAKPGTYVIKSKTDANRISKTSSANQRIN